MESASDGPVLTNNEARVQVAAEELLNPPELDMLVKQFVAAILILLKNLRVKNFVLLVEVGFILRTVYCTIASSAFL